MESHLMGLTIDFSMGFVCFDAASKVSVGQSFIINKSMENRFFQWVISNNCIAHNVMKLITTPQLPFFFFCAANLFCTVCILGV